MQLSNSDDASYRIVRQLSNSDAIIVVQLSNRIVMQLSNSDEVIE